MICYVIVWKEEEKPVGKPAAFYIYTQSENYRGFKRYKLSSYGHTPAENGIRKLTGKDLTGANIKISIFDDEYPRAVVSVAGNEVGTIWKHSFDKFNDVKSGRIEAVRLEIRDGESYLFYK